MKNFIYYFPTLATGFPLQVVFFVTNRCNSKCRMCFNWKNQNLGQDLSLPEISKLTKSMKPFYWLLISGGEPFLRNDLDRICDLFYENCKVRNISIPTNAILSEKIEETVKKILEACPEAKIIITLSLDGIGDMHDQIRGVTGSFEKLLQTYRLLSELRAKSKNLFIAINVTFSYYNQEKLKDIYNFVKNNLQVDNFNISFVRGNTREEIAKKVDYKLYAEFFNFLSKEKNNLKFAYYPWPISLFANAKDSLQSKIIIDVCKGRKWRINCLAGQRSVTITAEGDIYPCELFLEKMGELRKSNFDFGKIWRSKRAKEIRANILNTGCSCTYECALSNSILFNPKAYPFLIKEIIKK